MNMAQISIRMDDTLKADADKLFGELGDPVYNPANMSWLEESIAQMKRGEVLHKTFNELESMTQ
jgi:hypothetical protein